MDRDFTDEEIKKALQQADANIGFEELEISIFKNIENCSLNEDNKIKVLRKDLYDE